MTDFNVLDLIDFSDSDNELSIDGTRFDDVAEFRNFLSDTDNDFSEIVVVGEFKHPQTKKLDLAYIVVRNDSKSGTKEFTCASPSYENYLLMCEIDGLI